MGRFSALCLSQKGTRSGTDRNVPRDKAYKLSGSWRKKRFSEWFSEGVLQSGQSQALSHTPTWGHAVTIFREGNS